MKTVTVAIAHLPPIYHVGALKKSQKNRYSLEGKHLSVSTNPIAWQYIAGINSDIGWKFSKTGERPLFFDVLATSDSECEKIVTWGVEQGLVKRAPLFSVTKDSEFDDEDRCMFFRTLRAAKKEALEDEKIDRIDWIIGTKDLQQRVRNAPLRLLHGKTAEDALAMVWAEVHEFDGVWWDEEYDPQDYSAPRGCLFRLDEWKRTQVDFTGCSWEDEDDNSYCARYARQYRAKYRQVALRSL